MTLPLVSWRRTFVQQIFISFSIFFLNCDNAGKQMKENDGGRDYTQEFWKLAITSQIGMLSAMANALDSVPKDMQGSWAREMYKTNANIFSLYFRTMEQAGAQAVEIQVSALRQSSEALKAVLSKMERGGKPPEAQTS
jgi:hypothetical protein